MELQDYMRFYVAEPGSEAERAIHNWRSTFIRHHYLSRTWAIEQGASAINQDQYNGRILGLVFPNKLPNGWTWAKNKKFAIPAVLSKQIMDQLPAKAAADKIKEIGEYVRGETLANELGFITNYNWKDDKGGQGSSGIGPMLNGAQIVFVGEGPIAVYAPDAKLAHELYVKEEAENAIKYPTVAKGVITCTNGADVWTPPPGFTEISQARWDLACAEYRVQKEEELARAQK